MMDRYCDSEAANLAGKVTSINKLLNKKYKNEDDLPDIIKNVLKDFRLQTGRVADAIKFYRYVNTALSSFMWKGQQGFLKEILTHHDYESELRVIRDTAEVEILLEIDRAKVTWYLLRQYLDKGVDPLVTRLSINADDIKL